MLAGYNDRLNKIYGAVVPVPLEERRVSAFERDYRLFLVNEGEHDLTELELFTGGFEGTGDRLSELNRMTRSLGPVTRGSFVLLEELDIYILDFVLWYHLGLIFADEVRLKAWFEIGKAYALRDRRYCPPLGTEAFYFPIKPCS
jgi:hypothetical protein